MLANIRQLSAHANPALHRWRQGVARGVGAALLDEQPEGE